MTPRCAICGGSVSMRQHAAQGLTRHNLCAELQKHGMPTPSLGDDCTGCNGAGCHPKSAACPAINPTVAQMEAWAPTCKRCGGSRVEPGSRGPGAIYTAPDGSVIISG